MDEEMMNHLQSIDKNRFLSGTKDSNWQALYKLQEFGLIEEDSKHKYVLTKQGKEFLHPIIRIPNDITLLSSDELVKLDMVLNFLATKLLEGQRGYWDVIEICVQELFKSQDRHIFRTIEKVLAESGLTDLNKGGSQVINQRGINFDSFIIEKNRQLLDQMGLENPTPPSPNTINITMGDGGIAGVNSHQSDLRAENKRVKYPTAKPNKHETKTIIKEVVIGVIISVIGGYLIWLFGFNK